MFESVVQRCMAEGLVGADGFAVDASLIAADANKQRSIQSKHGKPEEIKESAVRAAREYLASLDDAAFGAASPVTPKFISRSDPAAQWTGAHKGHAFFAYAANYLIDTDHGVVVDVEATRAIRQAQVGAARTMLERTETRFGVKPDSLTADRAYGSAESLVWLVKQKGITHSFVSSTSPTEPTARSPAPTSPSTPNATVTLAPRAKNWFNSDAPTPFPEAVSRPRGQGSIAPANWIAMSANSKPSVVRTLLPARSRGIWTKMLATSPVRTPQRQNTWRAAAGAKKSRCCLPISSESCASRACA
jgi:Transposase DDE domain